MLTMSEEEFAELCDSDGGICLQCEERSYGIEPDARNYECENCGEHELFGAEELLIRGEIEFE